MACRTCKGHVFDTGDLAVSAAIRGHGGALGDMNLVNECQEVGTLVAPFEDVVDEGPAYCLVYSNRKTALPKIQPLRNWLQSSRAAP